MAMLTPILIGAAVGAFLALAAIFGNFEVKTKNAWEEEERRNENMFTCIFFLNAENAKLRVALAAGEMTEEGKKIATRTMAALDTVISGARKALLEDKPSPIASQEAAQSLETSE
jgi:hypothetical protein